MIRKNLHKKPVEKDSPYYQEFKSRGLLYVYNPVEENIDNLLKGMKGLGFVQKLCDSRKLLSDRIESDVKSVTIFKQDYCVAVLTVTESKFKNENELIKKFHGDNCLNLVCKPKLFFFLTISKQHCGEEVTDGSHKYFLAHEADLFIYKHTSREAVKDLTTFIERLNQAQEGFYVPDALATHLRTINRPKISKNALTSCSTLITKPKPTIHDSLTRRLMLGPNVFVIDKKDLYYKNINGKLLTAMEFIYYDTNLNENLLDVNLDNLKSQIIRKRNCYIQDGEKILEKLNLFIDNYIRSVQ